MRLRGRALGRLTAVPLIWLVAILWSFPLWYMLITSFKGEADAGARGHCDGRR